MNTLTLGLLLLLAVTATALYARVRLRPGTAAAALALAGLTVWSAGPAWQLAALWLVFAAVAVPLNVTPLRRRVFGRHLLAAYQRAAPSLSDTERAALEAGTVGFEGELFGGRPRWSELMGQPAPGLSREEQAFLEGPVAEVCRICDDWEITHELADLPEAVWRYLAEQRFFGMIIPKRYGGLGFSATAHSAVLQKLAARSATLASTVAVPNSLGPAELLLHYGTAEQKDHYLPRLARGEEIPCFGLTGPTAGSDATALPDTGVVCKGEWQGREVLGLRLNFDKRYITLAPIATLIGVAFRMQDPDHLLGGTEDLGITLALVPHDTPGVEAGRRHLPLNIPFQNGPVRGHDVFVPLDTIIGGPSMAGKGWRMLVEVLSVGRAISLPSNSAGGAKAVARATGAYARIRSQFGLPVGQFEGVGEALARVAGHTYQLTATSRMTAAAVDRGEKPSVPSAIAKYHTTELARAIARDAMDVHGGKGVILGPRNYLGRAWQGAPISITVEGANILTRSLMIFGQGSIRCHPYLLDEMEAAALEDETQRLARFDDLIFRHAGHFLSNLVRAPVTALTGGRLTRVPRGVTARHFRRLSRFSAALALASDAALMSLGGALKKRESLSGRLGDVLSQLFIASAMLKRYHDQGCPAEDRPLLDWAIEDCCRDMEAALAGVCRNFPARPLGWLLRGLIFPLGVRARTEDDRLGRRVAELLMTPGAARDRLTEGIWLDDPERNELAQLDRALALVLETEPLERRLTEARRDGSLAAADPDVELDAARKAGLITTGDAARIREARALVAEIIAVDDFEAEDLMAGQRRPGGSSSRQVA